MSLYQFNASSGNNNNPKPPSQAQPSAGLYGSGNSNPQSSGLYGSGGNSQAASSLYSGTPNASPLYSGTANSSGLYNSTPNMPRQDGLYGSPSPQPAAPARGRGGIQGNRGSPRPGPPPAANRGQPPGANPSANRGQPPGANPPAANRGLYASNTPSQFPSNPPAVSQGGLYGTTAPAPQSAPQVNLYATQPVTRTPPALSRTTSAISRTRQSGQVNNDISNFMVHFTVKHGSKLVAKDSNGKSDPYVVCEFFEGKQNPDKTWNISKFFNKSTTPVIEKTLEPQWNFCAYVLNAKTVKESYQGVRFWCFDKDLVGSDDFMGEAFLPISDIDFERRQNKDYQLNLAPRAKKKEKVSGFIVVSVSFHELKSSADHTAYVSTKSLSELVPAALSRSERVQISATGRREIQFVSASGSKTLFGELPALEFETREGSLLKHERKYGYHNNLSLWLVTCAQLAYRDDDVVGDVVRNVWDMYGYKFINDDRTDTQGFCMHNDKICVVCFRGTESIRDWITNVNFVMVAAPHYPQRYLKAGVRVHNGFNEALTSVWPQVKAFVDKAMKCYPGIKLFICGHSLGGALANLCFSYFVMSDTPTPVEGVYTIGQPRAGNKKFKEQLELASPNTPYIRITNNQDCVPSLAGGQHCGTQVHINSTGIFAFNPPTWKRAASKAQAIQGSAANMQYAGIADHGSGVYRKRIENYWIKSQSSKLASNDSAFELCEQILFVIDILNEDVKSVRRYKPQFRALVHQVLKMKEIISATLNYFGGGVDANSGQLLKGDIGRLFEKLSKLRKQILARQSKKSIIQKANKNSEVGFNKKMKSLALDLQKLCDTLNDHLKSAAITPVKNLYDWVTPTPVEPWTGALYDVDFKSINFEQISLDAKNSASVPHTSKLLETAESMIEEGKLEQALATLDSIEKGGAAVGTLGEEDKVFAAFLRAKAHAKLHHHKEAMSALEAVSNSGMLNQSMVHDMAFMSLRNQADFSKFESQCANIQSVRESEAQLLVAKLNNFELHTLSRIFDEADDNGDNFLTIEEFSELIRNCGGLEEILEDLDWAEDGVNKQPILDTILQDMRMTYNNATDLDQFISLMVRFMPR